ncbi:hypothetical protein OG21DRAFT_1249671 [Imleria badia]|nr:hypothetical protein OG21DRAFT_1249671 [Imleria badia]
MHCVDKCTRLHTQPEGTSVRTATSSPSHVHVALSSKVEPNTPCLQPSSEHHRRCHDPPQKYQGQVSQTNPSMHHDYRKRLSIHSLRPLQSHWRLSSSCCHFWRHKSNCFFRFPIQEEALGDIQPRVAIIRVNYHGASKLAGLLSASETRLQGWGRQARGRFHCQHPRPVVHPYLEGACAQHV